MRLVIVALLAAAPGAWPAPAHAGPPAKTAGPTLVLLSPGGGERLVTANDFEFVYFERIFYDRPVSRSIDPSGRRLEIEDRRRQCRCIVLDDLTEIQFRKTRQIEIARADDGAIRLRLTGRNGEVREVPFEALSGAVSSFAPRFGATVDGRYREFPLGRRDAAEDAEEERLARVLLARPRAPRPEKRRSR